MIDSAPDMRAPRIPQSRGPGMGASRACRLVLTLGLALGLACAGRPVPTPAGSSLAPLPRRGGYIPDEADRTAAGVARAVLRRDRQAVEARVDRLARLEEAREEDEPPSGLVPHALDAATALDPDDHRRRRKARELLERDDLPEPLRSRLRIEAEDDPLRLADARLGDARQRSVATVVNGVVSPVGRSLGNPLMLPIRLSQSLVATLLALHRQDELSVPERQALAHWKRFIDVHPDSPEAPELLERVQEAQAAWSRTQRDHELRAARKALAQGRPRLALARAERALRYRPEDPEASELRDEARTRVRRRQAAYQRSLEADPAQAPRAAERPLAVALLTGEEVAREARALRARVGADDPLADEALLALAWARIGAGEEERSWEILEELADQDPEEASAARHARALVESPRTHPARAFDRARRRVLGQGTRFVLLGPLAEGARDRDLPRPVEWLVEVPALPAVVLGLPGRLLRAPFIDPQWGPTAAHARRYLERYPEGEQADRLREWLIDYELGRGNAVGALALREADPDADPQALVELRERAAQQALEASLKERRPDVRLGLLAETAERFEGTPAARRAGQELRQTVEQSSSQRIRVSRSFLREHPEVAGPRGLALLPGVLDGELDNGELHPDGITLLGGLEIELAFVGPRGREREPPETRREKISAERLARVVALLEASQHELVLTDRDASMEHDADRDRFFERARLGLADRADTRPHARSSYAYRSMRERYGLVRARESILPVELVLQGSFDDWSAGAFPRLRMPKETPDAFLYR